MDEVELQDRFVKNVERILRLRDMSRSDLAAAMGVQRQFVTNYLNKRSSPGLKVIAEFAKGLQVDPVELIQPIDVPLGAEEHESTELAIA